MQFLWLLILMAPATTNATTSRGTTQPAGGPITPPARRDVPGARIDLPAGRMFVPDFFVEKMNVDLVIWFRGAAWCVEQEFYDAHKNAILFTWNEGKRKLGFANETDVDGLLRDISEAIVQNRVSDKPIDKICLGAFSGGYVAVHDFLAIEKHRAEVSDVVLADALYPPRDPAQFEPALAPILEFARRAAGGHGTLIFSQLYPPEETYRTNGTTLAANWLIERVGAQRISKHEQVGSRLLLYRADLKRFHVLGFSGMTNQDHFEHLYNAHELLRETSLDPP